MTLRRILSAEDQATADKHEQLEQTAHERREAVERFRRPLPYRACSTNCHYASHPRWLSHSTFAR
jgi:hypothetical protein